ncbi:MAG: hypothetical protein CNIPEHKO_03172 [Anaerolineales bacterium]|nr:hypothetical protein [Anaerolineales bacterium]
MSPKPATILASQTRLMKFVSIVFNGNPFFKHKGHDGHKGKNTRNPGSFSPLCTLYPSW